MMIAGNTEFDPDQHLSIWKNKFTNMFVEMYMQVDLPLSSIG